MQIIHIFSILALLAIVSGCATTSKSPESLSQRYMNETLVVSNPALVEVLNYERLDDFESDNQLIQVNLYNKSDKPVQVTYRIDWFNNSGFVVRSTDPQRVRIFPNDFVFITDSADSNINAHARVVVY